MVSSFSAVRAAAPCSVSASRKSLKVNAVSFGASLKFPYIIFSQQFFHSNYRCVAYSCLYALVLTEQGLFGSPIGSSGGVNACISVLI